MLWSYVCRGHMNVLLEEEKVPAARGQKEEIDGQFAQVDVVTV